jgi:hypothetical protein
LPWQVNTCLACCPRFRSSYPIERAIFTLNQDLLLETHYHPNLVSTNWSGVAIPGLQRSYGAGWSGPRGDASTGNHMSWLPLMAEPRQPGVDAPTPRQPSTYARADAPGSTLALGLVSERRLSA